MGNDQWSFLNKNDHCAPHHTKHMSSDFFNLVFDHVLVEGRLSVEALGANVALVLVVVAVAWVDVLLKVEFVDKGRAAEVTVVSLFSLKKRKKFG